MNWIDAGLWKIKLFMMKKYGTDCAYRDFAPLEWYVSTGRASTFFLRKLFEYKPYMIARKLHEGGSYDEVLQRIKKYIVWNQKGE